MNEIRRLTTQPWNIMEICGGQTHAIMEYGIDQLLPQEITLIHGPGCPVCVTSVEIIEHALQIASQPNVIFTSFGDMLRVPGNTRDLFSVRAQGGDVRVVYSPMDSVRIAQENPDQQVVFFGVGFETTVPSIAASILHAQKNKVNNFSVLPANVLVPPAMHAILNSPDNRVNAFLAAGHVCAIMGYREYEPIAVRYHTPIVVTGFDPLDLALGILMCVRQLEAGDARVQNAYPRYVTRDGNAAAQAMIRTVFEPVDRQWRGIGSIPLSGLGMRPEFKSFDATTRFDLEFSELNESPDCIAGLVLRGVAKPLDCPAFGTLCTPSHPLGAPMVSGEGACAAYYRYHKVN
jgi:hydrogenase expression/formation protein HypD